MELCAFVQIIFTAFFVIKRYYKWSHCNNNLNKLQFFHNKQLYLFSSQDVTNVSVWQRETEIRFFLDVRARQT